MPRVFGWSISLPLLLFVCNFRVCRVQSISTSVNKFITRRVGGRKWEERTAGNRSTQQRDGGIPHDDRIEKLLLAGSAHKPRITRLSDYLITRRDRRMTGLVSRRTGNRGALCGGNVSPSSICICEYAYTPTRPTNAYNTPRQTRTRSAKPLPQNQQCFTRCRSGDRRCPRATLVSSELRRDSR